MGLISFCYFWFAVLSCLPSILLVHSSIQQVLGEYLDATSEKILLLHFPRLGMVNRLRTMADWYRVAYGVNRTLLVVWDVTLDCNAGFHDLFNASTNAFQVFDNYGEGASVTEISTFLSSRGIQHEVLDPKSGIWVEGHSSFVLKYEAVSTGAQVLLTSCDGVITLEGVNCVDYAQQHSAFLASLVSHPLISKLVQDIYSQQFSDHVMVGVHYRAHDSDQDWAVVPPLLGTVGFQDFEKGASVKDFLEHMNSIATKSAYISNTENAAPGIESKLDKPVRFFIASNSEAAKVELSSRFPSAIYLGGDHRRDTTEGMKLALVEWLLLSKSALILHTYGSTFAEQAAQVHNCPVIGIWEGKLLHHSSIQLPFCGNQQYAKADGIKRRALEKVFAVIALFVWHLPI